MITRVSIGTAGVALAGFGVYRLATQIDLKYLQLVGIWLIAALVLHDGILSPSVAALGALVRRLVPDRARGYVQFGFVVCALVTVIALPIIHRSAFRQPPSKAILRQDYTGNLAVLLGSVVALTALAYVLRLVLDARRSGRRDR